MPRKEWLSAPQWARANDYSYPYVIGLLGAGRIQPAERRRIRRRYRWRIKYNAKILPSPRWARFARIDYKCLRCGHNWQPRIDGRPKQCPTCKSPYWDRPRKIGRTI